MARDPRFDPRNILRLQLRPGEQVKVIIDGARLCRDFRLSGPVHVSMLIGQSIIHAAQGGTWVPGIWAISDTSLHYVSRRYWFGWHGGQAFDIKVPLRSMMRIQRIKRIGLIRGVCYEMIYPNNVVRFWASTREADRFIPLLMEAHRQVAN